MIITLMLWAPGSTDVIGGVTGSAPKGKTPSTTALMACKPAESVRQTAAMPAIRHRRDFPSECEFDTDNEAPARLVLS